MVWLQTSWRYNLILNRITRAKALEETILFKHIHDVCCSLRWSESVCSACIVSQRNMTHLPQAVTFPYVSIYIHNGQTNMWKSSQNKALIRHLLPSLNNELSSSTTHSILPCICYFLVQVMWLWSWASIPCFTLKSFVLSVSNMQFSGVRPRRTC